MRITILLTLVVLVASGAVTLIQYGTTQERFLIGGIFAVVGLPLLVLARRQLGKAFAVTPQAKGLITHGLYAKIPHPMYVFLDLTLLGGLIILRQAWFLMIWAALVIVQAWQARREAKVLELRFDDAYREYRKHTW